ncbi:MAG: response regulator [Planctomycetota bacterium]|nr:response regulator [Planctomycetota bacterium]
MALLLLAEDDTEIRGTLQRLLEHVGHQVVAVADGSQAAIELKSQKYDLMITDLIMPNGEGLENIISARRDYPNLAIIAISGGGANRAETYLELAQKLGASVFKKPVAPRELIGEIERLLN